MAGAKFLLTMTLQKQGQIKGGGVKKNAGSSSGEDGMICHGFQYSVITQIDPSHGGPIGRRKHHPITIRREVDSASPLLLQALCTNETFHTANLVFGANTSRVGVREIELRNGHIVSIVPGGFVDGKRIENVTVVYEEHRVNGMPVQVLPANIMG